MKTIEDLPEGRDMVSMNYLDEDFTPDALIKDIWNRFDDDKYDNFDLEFEEMADPRDVCYKRFSMQTDPIPYEVLRYIERVYEGCEIIESNPMRIIIRVDNNK